MPIDDYMPVLDDQTYTSILDEMRSRIPRYTPEWKPSGPTSTTATLA